MEDDYVVDFDGDYVNEEWRDEQGVEEMGNAQMEKLKNGKVQVLVKVLRDHHPTQPQESPPDQCNHQKGGGWHELDGD